MGVDRTVGIEVRMHIRQTEKNNRFEFKIGERAHQRVSETILNDRQNKKHQALSGVFEGKALEDL